MKITELMSLPPEQHDVAWLKEALQAAIQLELSTIPPYLCSMWSVKDSGDPVRELIYEVVMEEMLHMGLACNMLTAIGGTPRLNTPDVVPKYPGPLPGGVRPLLRVALSRLTADVVEKTFMQIEYPESGPIAIAEMVNYATIGDFYSAISAAFTKLAPSALTGTRQITNSYVELTAITSVADALKAIQKIKEQGEGTAVSPKVVDFDGELAHYYKFSEILRGRRLVQSAAGKWSYDGDPLPFPETYPMAEVPAGGYKESHDFDKLYTDLLDKLQAAWQNGDASKLTAAVHTMRLLESEAVRLMQRPLPGGGSNYGPSFLLIRDGGSGMTAPSPH